MSRSLPERRTATGRALLERQIVQIADVKSDPEYGWEEASRFGDFRTIIGVPMLREGVPIGVLALTRSEVRPFSDKQIELLATFADQAAIAIENVRLFDEVQARTQELSVSLEYQTATADVLNVISRSPSELQPVLDAIVQTAARLCSAEYAFIARYVDGKCYLVAGNRVEADQYQVSGRPPGGCGPRFDHRTRCPRTAHHPRAGRAGRSRIRSVRVAARRQAADRAGRPIAARSVLIGVIILARTQVEPFDEQQIELVTTFADQAVIAIENVRLFDEIQDKSRQLAEASQHKSQFLANMSHELRTPLNAILGYTELIMDGIYGEMPDKMRDVLERVQKQRPAPARPDQRRARPLQDRGRPAHARARRLFAEGCGARRLQRGRAARRGEEARAQGRAAARPAAGPRRRAAADAGAAQPGRQRHQVHRPGRGGDQGARRPTARSTSSVRDTGPGIAEADQAKLFEEFQQADNSITKKKGGTGLGLAISKRIIETARRAASGSSPASGRARPSPSRFPSRSNNRTRASMSKRILVVEDQEDNRRILRDLLTSARLRDWSRPATARRRSRRWRSERPDLILMDIQLPVMDGYEATRRIKADPASASDPDHRRDLLCVERRRGQGARGGLRRLCDQALQPASVAGEDPPVFAVTSGLCAEHSTGARCMA